MSLDEQHVALPKLYGAPAYARPRPSVEPAPRPFDPDELPIAAVRTPEEDAYASSLPARAYAAGGAAHPDDAMRARSDGLKARPFRLRAIAGRLFGGNA